MLSASPCILLLCSASPIRPQRRRYRQHYSTMHSPSLTRGWEAAVVGVEPAKLRSCFWSVYSSLPHHPPPRRRQTSMVMVTVGDALNPRFAPINGFGPLRPKKRRVANCRQLTGASRRISDCGQPGWLRQVTREDPMSSLASAPKTYIIRQHCPGRWHNSHQRLRRH